MLTKELLAMHIMLKEYDEDDKFLKINMGRRQGHTTAMLDFASAQDIVVYSLARTPGVSETAGRLCSKYTIDSLRGTVHHCRYVFIDNFNSYFSHEFDCMMDSLMPLRPKMFILLQ